MLFLAMGSNLSPTYITLSTKIGAFKVFDHEKPNGGVHFPLRGDQRAGMGLRELVQGHKTMQIQFFKKKKCPWEGFLFLI